MIIVFNKDIVRNLLIMENFFNEVPEYYFLKEAGSRIVNALDSQGGCSSCTEANLIQPTISAFISHTVNMRLDCGPDAMIKVKDFMKKLYSDQDLVLKVLYKPTDESEIEELEL